ncbi:response regulator [Geothrix sp. PMB-07]|uniref:response regulator n=1 Tax=Geothrix sp. PMB-07 TaxID=3068640 RepID=UPI0027420C09|nr:response regulator [Geothrix sp. PMB-07]WLT30257.1 response regulator [Geothrix sp. PMB-07]
MTAAPLNAAHGLKILVVDDDPITRRLVRAALEMDGFEVILARDGKEGLAFFQAQAPDLVLTDYSMPGMSGAEFTQRIRALSAEGQTRTTVPVVVFTGHGEVEVLKDCLEAGAEDFLIKPFTIPELRIRIRATAELVAAHASQAAREAEERDEIAVVKHVLNRLLEPGKASLPRGFVMETLATRRINGDICTYRAGAPGIHFGMVCDPMGHGLMAGISGIPTLDVFNALAARNFPLLSILEEINEKLIHLLPLGRFSCAVLFRMDWHTREFFVINAAMPDAFVLRGDGAVVKFPSTGIPLGIQKDLGAPAVGRVRMAPGDCFFACSDGLTDIVDEAQILDTFRSGGLEGFTGRLRALVEQRIGNLDLADDVSWCLWPFEPDWAVPAASEQRTTPEVLEGRTLDLCLRFHPNVPAYQEMGSTLVGFLGRHGVSRSMAQNLALLLSETIINAVDHGVLQLDSALKEVDFERYDLERRSRLKACGHEALELQVSLHIRPDGVCSHLLARMADPGRGFDWRQYLADMADTPDKLSGRGLLLLKALGQDLTFNEAGNEVCFSLHALDG